MAAAMQRANFNSLLFEGLSRVFFQQYNDKDQIAPKIYTVRKSNQYAEDDQIIAGIGMLEQKGESEPIVYESMVEGYSKRYIHTTWAKGMTFSQELIEDAKYGVMKKRTAALARAAWYRREYEAAKLFNYANATTYFTGADGLALLSSSHTLSGKPGITVSNTSASTALSLSALETALTAFRRLVDDQNMLIGVKPAVLLIPPELEIDAIELLQSDNKPYTADNETNAIRGRLKIVVWDFITDTNCWFVLAEKSEDMSPTWYDRVPISYQSDSDFDTDDLKVKARTRFSNGFTDWRWVYGSMGAT